MLAGWLELATWTLVLYPTSFFVGTGRSWYRRLFRIWCRSWVHALGVELRIHQQNAQPLPERFILIANHPSAFEDIGIPALFDVDSLAKTEVQHWWIVGRISVAAGIPGRRGQGKTGSRDVSVRRIRRFASHRHSHRTGIFAL